MRSPDIVNEMIDANRALGGRAPPKPRASSQGHQNKPNEEADHDAEMEAKKLSK